MKTKIQIVLTVVFVTPLILLFIGCAQVGPAMVSPAVYKSSRDVMVAENRAQRQDIELEQARANEWQKVAVADIQGKATGGGKNDRTITADGVLGGFPCIFINDSRRTKTLTIQKIGGFLGGKKWDFTLTGNGGLEKFKLPVGNYSCWWITEYSNQSYPTTGPARFRVTTDPHFYYGKMKENFHGGYRLYGY